MEKVQLSVLASEDVESGEEIVLLCSVAEGTGPITYKFYNKKEDNPFYQTITNATHAYWRKTKVSKEQEGQYYCTASNRASSPRSSPQSNTLTVRGESGSQRRVQHGLKGARTKIILLVRGSGWEVSSGD